ncbi:uncharacterized protein TM35_000221380, partial [Trypanosoma theileri]
MSHYRRRLGLLILAAVLCLSVFHVVFYQIWLYGSDGHNVIDKRFVERTPLSHPDEGNGSSESHLGWSATMCDPSSLLTHRKLRQYCRDPSRVSMPVSPVYCEMILRRGPPPCGFYVGGVFRKPLKLLSLDALKEQLRGEPEACFSPATYNGQQSNATLVASDIGDASDAVFEVRPAACPSYRYFSPRVALSILHHASIGRNGRGILITGDSMMRQVMMRLMFFLRGEEVFSEHYFHHDGLYVVFEDRDELIIELKCQHNSLLDTYFPGYRTPSTENSTCPHAAQLGGRVVAIFLFLWDPTPLTFREDVFRMKIPPVHLASFMYWWKRGVS